MILGYRELVMYKCSFSNKDGKESKRLSKFDLFCCLNDDDVLNPREKDERPTAARHLLLVKGKIPRFCDIMVSPRLTLLGKKTPFMSR